MALNEPKKKTAVAPIKDATTVNKDLDGLRLMRGPFFRVVPSQRPRHRDGTPSQQSLLAPTLVALVLTAVEIARWQKGGG